MKEKLTNWFINSAIKDFERGMVMLTVYGVFITISFFTPNTLFGVFLAITTLALMTMFGLKYHYFGRDLYDTRLYLLIKERGKQK